MKYKNIYLIYSKYGKIINNNNKHNNYNKFKNIIMIDLF
jgi:hypothetical protein